MTRDTFALACVLALCCALFMVGVSQQRGARVTVTPVIEPASVRWIQLYHGTLDGSRQIRVPEPLEELYPGSGWMLFNVRVYFENNAGGIPVVRIAGVTHWVAALIEPVSFHADATERDGAWWIDSYSSAPCFVDLWGIF